MRIILLILAAALLAGCATPGAATPTPTCLAEAQVYDGAILALVEQFQDTEDVAAATSRVSLAPMITQLQGLKREIEAVTVPPCLAVVDDQLKTGLAMTVDGYIDFLGNGSGGTTSLGRLLVKQWRSAMIRVLNGEEPEAAIKDVQSNWHKR